MTQLADKYYRMLIRAASSLQSPFLLAVRLYWGWQFMQTGWGKIRSRLRCERFKQKENVTS